LVEIPESKVLLLVPTKSPSLDPDDQRVLQLSALELVVRDALFLDLQAENICDGILVDPNEVDV